MLRLAVLWLVFFMSAAGTTSAAAPLRVVTTTAQIADVVRNVAGPRAMVESIMGEAVDPHTYRQTRSDIVTLRRADLVLYNGLYLEPQLEPLLQRLATSQNVVAVGEKLDPEMLLSHPDYDGKFDPHIWMDVAIWSRIVPVVVDALALVEPDERAFFEERAKVYLDELAGLGAYVREVLASIPERSRILVTAHDAFRYLARANDIEVVGIQGLSTESEAGLQRVETLVDMLVERGVGAVFVESSVPRRNIMALVEGCAARGHGISVGGSLYSDAMGAPNSYEGTYVGMIDHNATAIASALGGTVPERGWQGRLGAGS